MISIVIPAYNEEKRLIPTVDSIISYFKNNKEKYEIIIVDDGSKDKTNEIIKVLASQNKNMKLIINTKNRGKGYSVKRGMLNAKGDYILFMDADNSTKINELDNFKKYFGKYDIIIGSRKAQGSKITIKQPFYRALPGQIFPLIVKLTILPKIKDTQCGFKLFTKKAAKEIFQKQTIYGFAFDVEILFIANKLRYKIKELPITWSNDIKSKLNVVKDSVRMLGQIMKVRWNSLSGKYN